MYSSSALGIFVVALVKVDRLGVDGPRGPGKALSLVKPLGPRNHMPTSKASKPVPTYQKDSSHPVHRQLVTDRVARKQWSRVCLQGFWTAWTSLPNSSTRRTTTILTSSGEVSDNIQYHRYQTLTQVISRRLCLRAQLVLAFPQSR